MFLSEKRFLITALFARNVHCGFIKESDIMWSFCCFRNFLYRGLGDNMMLAIVCICHGVVGISFLRFVKILSACVVLCVHFLSHLSKLCVILAVCTLLGSFVCGVVGGE